MVHLHQDRNKTQQCINFFSSKLVDPTTLQVLKLIYLAERLHLRKYGRLISDVGYYLSPSGIVPNISTSSTPSDEEYDSSVMSESDLKCLSQIYEHFKDYSLSELIEYCNHLAEHALAVMRFSIPGESPVNVLDFLEDPSPLVEELHPLSKHEKTSAREYLLEVSEINRLLLGGRED